MQNLINENKTDIQDQLVTKIVKELLDTIAFQIPLKDILFKKITDGIEKRYNDNSDFNLSYDLGLSDIVKQIYEENENQYNDILKEKIDKTLEDYRVDSWVISNRLSTILAYNPDYKEKLEELLDSRLEEIFDKIW